MTRIALVTCRAWPALSKSDALYAAALQDRGAICEAIPWNDAGRSDFSACDAAILRSNWDYHDHMADFTAWLQDMAACSCRLFNPPDQVLHFADKRSLIGLQAAGIPMALTRAAPFDAHAVDSIMAGEGWDKAVLKPVHGASGRGVELVERHDVEAALARVQADVGARDLLVQEFLPEIHEGELQLIFFDGRFSHGVRKIPAVGEFRSNSKHQPTIESFRADETIIQGAVRVLAMLDPVPLYARVDGVVRNGTFYLNELELNEPGLWLDHAGPKAAEAFADATLERLTRVTPRRPATPTASPPALAPCGR